MSYYQLPKVSKCNDCKLQPTYPSCEDRIIKGKIGNVIKRDCKNYIMRKTQKNKYLEEYEKIELRDQNKRISKENDNIRELFIAFISCGVEVVNPENGLYIPFLEAIEQLLDKWKKLEYADIQKELLDCFNQIDISCEKGDK